MTAASPAFRAQHEHALAAPASARRQIGATMTATARPWEPRS